MPASGAQTGNLFSAAVESYRAKAEITKIIPLVPEASTRRYYRLFLEDGATLVGVHEDIGSAATTMPLVMEMQAFLAGHGISVPRILFTDVAQGTMLQQDLGDMSLNQWLRQNPGETERAYREAMDHMFAWQQLRDDGRCPAYRLSFDVPKLMFEFEFFITHTLLGYYKAQISQADLSRLRRHFSEIAERLAAPANKVFTHRDYHSRNIMLCDWKQYVIDFQDARLGLMQYDLCSLLCDAYAPMTPAVRNPLLSYAFDQAREIHRQSQDEFMHYFTLSAFQRLVKAAGTFGRQAALGRDDYAACLAPVRCMLDDVCQADHELLKLAKQIEYWCQAHD